MSTPFKMYGKSPMMKALIGKQGNLPALLKNEILASPAKAKKVTNEDGSTTRTSKNILTGRTKTVTRNEEGKKTSVSKRSKTDKEGNVKYKQKDTRRGSGGKKIVHTSKGKYSEKTGAQVGTSKEKVKRNYGSKKGTTKYTEEALGNTLNQVINQK